MFWTTDSVFTKSFHNYSFNLYGYEESTSNKTYMYKYPKIVFVSCLFPQKLVEISPSEK